MDLYQQRMMMLDIDGVLTHHDATPIDVLTAAQALAVSAVGDLVNKSAAPTGDGVQSVAVPQQQIEALHRFADGIADQIRAALHARIDLGHRPDW